MFKHISPILAGILSALIFVLVIGRINRVNRFINSVFSPLSSTLSVTSSSSNNDTTSSIESDSSNAGYITKLENTDSSQLILNDLPSDLENADINEFLSPKDYSDLEKILEDTEGEYSLYVHNLNSDELFIYNSEKEYYAASLFKTPLAISTYLASNDDVISFTDLVTYTPSDFADGSGVIANYGYGASYSIDTLINYLLKYSDNSAQVMLMRILPDNYEVLGYKISPLEGTQFYSENIATVSQVSAVYEDLYMASIGKDSAYELTVIQAQDIINRMKDTAFEDRLSLGISENSEIAHKIGNWGDTGSWHDCGYIFTNARLIDAPKTTHIVCLMSEYSSFEEVAEVSKKVAEFVEN